jgi:hypothetical protein
MKQILCHFYRMALEEAGGKSEAENFDRLGDLEKY